MQKKIVQFVDRPEYVKEEEGKRKKTTGATDSAQEAKERMIQRAYGDQSAGLPVGVQFYLQTVFPI